MKKPEPPQRWQAANFYSQQIVTVDELTSTFILAVELAKIINHLTEDPGLGGTEGSNAIKLAGAYKRIEIGGIVFDSGFQMVDTDGESLVDPGALILHELLVMDQLDPVDAFPITAASFDWTRNQVPINTIPNTGDEQQDAAMRILWRNTNVTSQTSSAGAVGAFNRAADTNVGRTKNLRLRRFLDDRTGLYFIQQVTAFTSALTFRYDVFSWLAGTLYWRARLS